MATNCTRILRPILALAAALGLGACASMDSVSTVEPASRNIAPASTLNAPVEVPAPQAAPSYKVSGTFTVTAVSTRKVTNPP